MSDDLPRPGSDPDSPPTDDADAVVLARSIDDAEEPRPAVKSPLGWREQIDRSWPLSLVVVLAVIMVTIVVFLMTSFFSVIAAELFVTRAIPRDADAHAKAVAAAWESRIGFILLILPAQLSLLIAPLAAAWILPEGMRRGLRLVRGRWPIWIWLAAAAATPFVGLLSTLIIGGFVEESETLKMLTEAFRAHARSGFLLPVALLIGLAPAICEEVLFRGYLQPRLARLTRPGVGLMLASLLFAAFHLDPVHVVLVFPIGLWLGFLSYRSGSIFPAILGHFVNNVLSVFAVLSDETGTLDVPDATIAVPVVAAGILGMLAAGYGAWRWKPGT